LDEKEARHAEGQEDRDWIEETVEAIVDAAMDRSID